MHQKKLTLLEFKEMFIDTLNDDEFMQFAEKLLQKPWIEKYIRKEVA